MGPQRPHGGLQFGRRTSHHHEMPVESPSFLAWPGLWGAVPTWGVVSGQRTGRRVLSAYSSGSQASAELLGVQRYFQ